MFCKQSFRMVILHFILAGTNKHLSAVTCLQLINKFVITSSDDGTVKLWDIRTGIYLLFCINAIQVKVS